MKENVSGTIIIHRPIIKDVDKKMTRIEYPLVYIHSLFEVDNKCVFVEFDTQYKKYVCADVCDPIIVAILPYAMKAHYNIKSDLPITQDLYHKIKTRWIPAIMHKRDYYWDIKIDADLVERTYSGRYIGTGVSGGVDSYCTIRRTSRLEETNYKTTHLVFFGFTPIQSSPEKKPMLQSKIAEKEQLPLVKLYSNVMSEISTYGSSSILHFFLFEMMILRNMWHRYYFASTYHLSDFSMDNYESFPDKIELLIADVVSTSGFSVEIDAVDLHNRLEKVAYLSDDPPALLSPCLHIHPNCGWCAKCIRTLLCIDACEKLEDYGKVFNIPEYMKYRSLIHSYLYNNRDLIYIKPAYEKLKQDKRLDSSNLTVKTFDELINCVIKDGCSGAMMYMGVKSYDQKDYSAAYKWLNEAISHGLNHNKAYYLIADMLHKGYGIERNLKNARKYMQIAYENGAAHADLELSDILWEIGTEESLNQMLLLLLKMAQDNNELAYGRIGKAYRFGKGVEKDLNKAADWMRKAANLGVGWAYNDLFDILWEIGTTESYSEMIQMIIPRAESGDKNAMARLGKAYVFGYGIPKDHDVGIKLLKNAYSLGVQWTKQYLD